MHVQPDQANVLHRQRDPGNGRDVFVGNSELASALSCFDVLMRRFERDFRIHANRDRSDGAGLSGKTVDSSKLLLGFDIEEHDPGVKRLANLGTALPDPAKDDVLRRVPRPPPAPPLPPPPSLEPPPPPDDRTPNRP